MAKKATEGTELQLQSHIQALLYIYNTDYMMSLITVHILHAPCICWLQWLRLLGQQINRRQWNEGKCELYHMIEKRSQNT